MQIYTGVPIGGTIAWLGHLAGIEIPDNFIYNHEVIIPKPRTYADFTRGDYDDWISTGYLSGGASNSVSQVGDNSFSLTLAQLPEFRVPYAEDLTHKYTLAEFDQRVDLGPSTSGGFNFDRTTTNDWVGGVSTSRRWFPSSSGFVQDGGKQLSGSGKRLLFNTGVYDTDTLNQHTHKHPVINTSSHTHSVSVTAVYHTFNPRGDVIVNTSQSAVSYQVRPPAIGVLWITRVY